MLTGCERWRGLASCRRHFNHGGLRTQNRPAPRAACPLGPLFGSNPSAGSTGDGRKEGRGSTPRKTDRPARDSGHDRSERVAYSYPVEGPGCSKDAPPASSTLIGRALALPPLDHQVAQSGQSVGLLRGLRSAAHPDGAHNGRGLTGPAAAAPRPAPPLALAATEDVK